MRLALAGPVQVHRLRSWLDVDADTPLPPGGSGGTPVTLLARALLARGDELSVVSLDPTIREEVVLAGPQLRLRLLPRRDRHRGRDAYRVERARLRQALEAERPDLIHAHWTYEYALAALRTGRPTLLTMHDWAPAILRLSPDPYRLVRLGMSARALLQASHVTVPSPYLRDKLRPWMRRPVLVVPNALPDEAFAVPAPRSSAPPRLVAVNDGFGRRKNTSTLLRAFALLRRTHPSSLLTMAGDGHGPGEEAQQWARERGLEGGVSFLGPVPYARVAELFAEATVFVHPSLEESFGLVLAEAMAQGLPVVAGERSGAVPWVLGGGEAGLLTDVSAPEPLAAAMAGLLDDDVQAAAYGKAGHDHAWTHFRLSRVLEQYLAAYQTALAGARR